LCQLGNLGGHKIGDVLLQVVVVECYDYDIRKIQFDVRSAGDYDLDAITDGIITLKKTSEALQKFSPRPFFTLI
jgi:hypothetical protein